MPPAQHPSRKRKCHPSTHAMGLVQHVPHRELSSGQRSNPGSFLTTSHKSILPQAGPKTQERGGETICSWTAHLPPPPSPALLH